MKNREQRSINRKKQAEAKLSVKSKLVDLKSKRYLDQYK